MVNIYAYMYICCIAIFDFEIFPCVCFLHIEMWSLKIAFSSHISFFFRVSCISVQGVYTLIHSTRALFYSFFFPAAPETEVRKYAEDMRTIESDLIVLREIQAKTATLSPAHEVGSSCQCLFTWCMHS